MSDVSERQKASDLIIDEEVGTLTVSGEIDPKDRAQLDRAIDAAKAASGNVVIVIGTAASSRARQAAEEAVDRPLRELANAVARVMNQRQAMENLIEQLSPAVAVPSRAAVLQARRNAFARTELLEEFGAVSASDVADLAGSSAANRSALAARWRKEGRIFGVSHHGATLFPLFQFDEEGRPLAVVRDVIEQFRPAAMSDWEIALWFVTRTGWLDDRRPVDLLASEPDLLRQAAANEVVPISG